jgi:hypothetical protein
MMIGIGDWVRTDKIIEEFFEGNEGSFKWFWRNNRNRLKDKGAVSQIGHSIYVHREKFLADRLERIEANV